VKVRVQVKFDALYVQPAGQELAVATCALRASEPMIKSKEIKHDLPKGTFFNTEKVWKQALSCTQGIRK
jgi:hypothetical protein